MDKIDCFDGKYAFLSNFYPTPITIDGITYPTNEHAFQAAKTMDPTLRLSISKLATPGQAKRAGRNLALRPDWEDIKLDMMRLMVKEKFESNPDLANLLLDTGEALLVEGNDWRDTFWGVCKNVGANNLGKILMDTRFDLHKNLLLNKSINKFRKTILIHELQYVNFGQDFVFTIDSGDGPMIESKDGNVAAIFTSKGSLEYYVTGVYNSSDDFAEIDMDVLMKLKAFCERLLK